MAVCRGLVAGSMVGPITTNRGSRTKLVPSAPTMRGNNPGGGGGGN